jgi:hypothetical protein
MIAVRISREGFRKAGGARGRGALGGQPVQRLVLCLGLGLGGEHRFKEL